jgi:hypothetical protein
LACGRGDLATQTRGKPIIQLRLLVRAIPRSATTAQCHDDIYEVYQMAKAGRHRSMRSSGEPLVVLLDEPTKGLDEWFVARRVLDRRVRWKMSGAGHASFLGAAQGRSEGSTDALHQSSAVRRVVAPAVRVLPRPVYEGRDEVCIADGDYDVRGAR